MMNSISFFERIDGRGWNKGRYIIIFFRYLILCKECDIFCILEEL